jgi:hypothetical protein
VTRKGGGSCASSFLRRTIRVGLQNARRVRKVLTRWALGLALAPVLHLALLLLLHSVPGLLRGRPRTLAVALQTARGTTTTMSVSQRVWRPWRRRRTSHNRRLLLHVCTKRLVSWSCVVRSAQQRTLVVGCPNLSKMFGGSRSALVAVVTSDQEPPWSDSQPTSTHRRRNRCSTIGDPCPSSGIWYRTRSPHLVEPVAVRMGAGVSKAASDILGKTTRYFMRNNRAS